MKREPVHPIVLHPIAALFFSFFTREVFFVREQIADICRYLQISVRSRYLQISAREQISVREQISADINNLQISADICREQISADICRYLQISAREQISADICRYLQISADICSDICSQQIYLQYIYSIDIYLSRYLFAADIK